MDCHLENILVKLHIALMEEFWQEYLSGQIHFRDLWQFELKSDFTPQEKNKPNEYLQEFYFFIPNALQINEFTYTKDNFFHDQTNLIRYKTPEFTIKELVNLSNPQSPLQKLRTLLNQPQTPEHVQEVESELKMLGNVVRSSIRNRVFGLLDEMLKPSVTKHLEEYNRQIQFFCDELNLLRGSFLKIQKEYFDLWTDAQVRMGFSYIDEFISSTINFFLTGFLDKLRSSHLAYLISADQTLCDVLIREKKYREEVFHEPSMLNGKSKENETFLYRNGLLNKYVIDSLHLTTNRTSLHQKLSHIIGAISAGIAMFVYVLFFAWFGFNFVITSAPFLIFSVLFYILKDRIKEVLKNISYRKALQWFSDYSTEVYTPDDKIYLGDLKESFTFVSEEDLSKDILRIRQRDFHEVLQMFKRPEQAMYYKKKVTIRAPKILSDPRRYAMNIIFRFNIQNFVSKASNPYSDYITIDPQTRQLITLQLPKVYHINIILKNSYNTAVGTKKIELFKFRIIVDKNGIKHIEHLS